MAQTQRNEMQDAGGNVSPISDAAADKAAWLETGKALGFRVEDNELWGGANDALYPVPALPGFAALPAGSRRLALYTVAKMADYRIGQTATGNVADAVAKFINDADFKPDRSPDAFEYFYNSKVRHAILSKLPEGTKTTSKVNHAGKDVTVQSIVAATADKYRAERFDGTIRAGIEAGRNRPTKGDAKAPRAKSGVTGMELDTF